MHASCAAHQRLYERFYMQAAAVRNKFELLIAAASQNQPLGGQGRQEQGVGSDGLGLMTGTKLLQQAHEITVSARDGETRG